MPWLSDRFFPLALMKEEKTIKIGTNGTIGRSE